MMKKIIWIAVCITALLILIPQISFAFTPTPENEFTWNGNTISRYNGTEKEVVIPNKATSIGANAFNGLYNLTDVTIPDSVTSIGDYAFANCTNLSSLILPNSTVSVGTCAFANCTSLKSITIPKSVTSAGDYAFYNSGSLQRIIAQKKTITQANTLLTRATVSDDCDIDVLDATVTFDKNNNLVINHLASGNISNVKGITIKLDGENKVKTVHLISEDSAAKADVAAVLYNSLTKEVEKIEIANNKSIVSGVAGTTIAFNGTIQLSDEHIIKIFVWNSVDGLKPLINQYIYPIPTLY